MDWTASRWDLDSALKSEQEAAGKRAEWETGLLLAEDTLRARLRKLSLDLHIMEGDGNCQFRSVAHSVYGGCRGATRRHSSGAAGASLGSVQASGPAMHHSRHVSLGTVTQPPATGALQGAHPTERLTAGRLEVCRKDSLTRSLTSHASHSPQAPKSSTCGSGGRRSCTCDAAPTSSVLSWAPILTPTWHQ